MPSNPREEEVLVLFASQTGNSEQAAETVAAAIPEKLSTPTLKVTAKHLQLDDFLELEQAQWTRLVVICMSSYGVGQAPLGGYRFRTFCDALLEKKPTTTLDGLTFALLGLGDSKYTTFFMNPTITNDALTSAGAKRVGDIGKADASGDQLKVIQDWIDGIWPSLKKALQQEAPSETRMKEMQHDTIAICRELDEEFMPLVAEATFVSTMTFWSVAVAIVSVAYYYYVMMNDAADIVEES